MGSVRIVLWFFYLVIGYQECFFQTSSYIKYKKIVTLGKCYECCIVSLVSCGVLGVLLSNLSLHNLLGESKDWEVLRSLYSFSS